MSAPDKRFRRNFVIASALHVAILIGVIFWGNFVASGRRPALASVELITPADILGDLPKGPDQGRGAYKPALEPPGPSEHILTPEEAPAPRAVAVPKSEPDEISIPKKVDSKKKTTPAKKAVAAAAKTKSTTTAAKSSSFAEIRNRLAKALSAAEGGTPRGDGKPAGGGSGKGPIGSPAGSPDGVVGGVGQGSPNWRYFEHVHDVMYEAWEQPGSALDKKLVATVQLRVTRDGTVKDVALRIPSGNKLMDDSVLAAARKVPRLDPPPDNLVRGDAANITVDFQVEG